MTVLTSIFGTSEQRTAASASALALDGTEPPKRIQLLKIGANPAREGIAVYRIDDRGHAEAIVAASNKLHGAASAMIDYDHQSVFGATKGVGGRAPAAGWMTKLTAEPDGIYADVEWTRAAATALGEREYRYISPYFGHDKSGRVTRIFNAALTNSPALELRAVASIENVDPFDPANPATTDPDLESFMDEITTALGLAAGASKADVVGAIGKLINERSAMCSALGVEAGATIDELRTAASSRATDPAQFVPRAEFDSLRATITSIGEERTTASVDAAIREGKVAPASRDWALGYAKSDPTGFATFVTGAPAILGETPELKRAAAIAADMLTDDEMSVCSAMGLEPAAFIKARKENAK